MQQVGDDAFHGTGTDVGWLAVRDGRDLTLVDTGWPGDVSRLEEQLAAIGHHPRDVRAVLLTHAHVDHMGALRHLHEAYGVPVLMHPDEVPLARGDRREQAGPLDVLVRAWRPRVAAWSARIMRAGALQHPRVAHAEAWAGPTALDLPGGPVPVPCPGHTSGHTAYLFPGIGVVATGDALVTAHPVTGIDGPQRLPDFFSHAPEDARMSLSVLADLDADTVVPGHGPVWRGQLAEAVAQAQA
ncbi:MBL fold metallo-hydrolase [Nocardioides marmoribigeumensis]|uniref:Glyoxylase-like metal-dependent hydrolase (Beta-lactamase superfamily II) n=1 Tax=Nocardioides marmoribigeumensis TaxID=433649 RepID=A0ABU2BT84_9ACTN|nr:MBL fold metallo-hydrolase [Nocardioides marmoribigeumensis]MDR7361845.1 glyoxylase-like metal-dependent hydrolase (beta-lactamase superfamily II) [Nocardioides marmoribigeumensis]